VSPAVDLDRSVPARIALFGHDPLDGAVRVRSRTRRWRSVRAARLVATGVVLAPVAALVPPHAPWAIGVAVTALLLGRRRWRERHTLVGVEGACPRCGASLRLPSSVPFRSPLPLDCDGCNHRPALYADPDGRV
jgi:hypothetical protein